MTSVPEGHAPQADPARTSAYDSFAEGYTAENETGLLNAHYNRPALLELAGDVTGRRILDAGCGSGPLFAALRDRGAVVTGIDASAGMLEQARRRLGDDADLRVADLADPLHFPDGAFDDVVASLVLHYLQDWGPTLAELRRVLAPGGRLIASVEHPFANFLGQRLAGEETNYFQTRNRTEEWTMGGQTAQLSFWDRPLHAMTEAFTAAGFRISVISEPPALPSAQDLTPEVFDKSTGLRFLCFLFFVCTPTDSPDFRGPIAVALLDRGVSSENGRPPQPPGGWCAEMKWDGVRAIVHCSPGRISLWSRNLRESTGSYPEIVDALAEITDGRTMLLDGKLVAPDDRRALI